MLFTSEALDGIANGRVTLVFRRWAAPRVRAGSELRTAVGVLTFTSVEPVDVSAISDHDVTQTGFRSRDDVIASLRPGPGRVYRVELQRTGPDPRVELREAQLSPAERAAMLDRLADWSVTTLKLIAEHPGRRAADLAGIVGMETLPFKQRVRRLKSLGLTESLEVGYRLSPRGRSLLERT